MPTLGTMFGPQGWIMQGSTYLNNLLRPEEPDQTLEVGADYWQRRASEDAAARNRRQEQQRRQEQPLPQEQSKLSKQEEITWESVRGKLTQNYGALDSAGQAEVNRLNQQTEAAKEAQRTGRLRQEEYEQAIQSIQGRAQEFPWEHHIKPPGSNIGDIIEENGIVKQRTEKGMEPMFFTPEYIQKNIVPLGNSGNVAVPVSPKEGYKIVPRKDWDVDRSQERDEILDTRKQIDEQFKELHKAREQRGDKISGNEITEMAVAAAEIVVKRNLQARKAYETIKQGPAKDLYRTELDITKAEKQMAQFGPPTPAPSPTPVSPVETPAAGANISPELMEQAAQLLATEDEQFRQRRDALTVARSQNPWEVQMIEAATMRYPTPAYSLEEFTTTFKDSPDGTVVQLPDRQRWLKVQGQFMQVPQWSDQQIQDLTRGLPSGQAALIENPFAGQDLKTAAQMQAEAAAAQPLKSALTPGVRESDIQILPDSSQTTLEQLRPDTVFVMPERPNQPYYKDGYGRIRPLDTADLREQTAPHLGPKRPDPGAAVQPTKEPAAVKTQPVAARPSRRILKDEELQTWAEDPQLRRSVMRPKVLAGKGGELKRQIADLEPGEIFQVKGSSAVSMKREGDIIDIPGAAEYDQYLRERTEDWLQEPEIMQAVRKAQPITTAKGRRPLKDGEAFIENGKIYLRVDGKDYELPGAYTYRIRGGVTPAEPIGFQTMVTQ